MGGGDPVVVHGAAGRDVCLSSLTLWPIYAGGYYVPVLKVGWTLSFELTFYLGMALAIATRAAVPLTLYALFLVGALTTSSPLLHFIGSPMALEFLMGVVIAGLPRRAVFGFLIPLGFVLFALTSPVIGDVESSLGPQWALWRAFEWGLPAALIFWGTLSLEIASSSVASSTRRSRSAMQATRSTYSIRCSPMD